MALKGLIIREPWIDEILAGRKTWELRSKPYSHRGEIALIRKGSGQVVGVADMVDCLPPLDEAGLRRTQHLHRVPAQMIDEVMQRGWRVPWVLANVRRLNRPVPYAHKPGAVITIDLDAQVEQEVRRRLGTAASVSGRKLPECPEPKPLALSRMSGEARAKAMAELPHIGGKSVRSITDADYPPQITSTAVSAPPIDASIAGKEPTASPPLHGAHSYPRIGLRLLVAIVAAIVGATAMAGWFIQLLISGPFEVLLSWAGWRWALPAMLAAFVYGAVTPEEDKIEVKIRLRSSAHNRRRR